MAAKIFVNYRRDDAKAEAARLCDRLTQTFGAANVFMDVNNLLVGERFDLKLQEALAETDVFLAVIGARWLELLKARTASGERDYVRDEIAAALARGLIVIPVPMDGAQLPRPEELPADIRDLVLHHKHDIAHESFGRDTAALLKSIKARRTGSKLSRSPLSKLLPIASSVVILAALLVTLPRVPMETPAAAPPFQTLPAPEGGRSQIRPQDGAQNEAREGAIDYFIREGNMRLRQHDVIGARWLYRQAVVLGGPKAALAMGRSYDPIYFARIDKMNAEPDAATAFHCTAGLWTRVPYK